MVVTLSPPFRVGMAIRPTEQDIESRERLKDIGSIPRVGTRMGRIEDELWREMCLTDLCLIHFKLSNHLDGDLIVLPCIVASAVDIRKCTVPHFFFQGPSLQAGIFR